MVTTTNTDDKLNDTHDDNDSIDLPTLHRGQQLSLAASYKKMASDTERKLKGLYLDYLFSNLNLSKYR